jgi:tRNA threonylcarbamoyladenosine biosynthesis protein TsaE
MIAPTAGSGKHPAVELVDEEATRALGAALAGVLRAGDVVVLEGDLGAGKTFLVRAVARGLGVPEDIPVTSPTFALVHELAGRMPIVHADLYRLDAPDDLIELGLLERLGDEALVLIEWGERFRDALRPDLVVRLELTSESSRSVAFDAISERGARIVGDLGI